MKRKSDKTKKIKKDELMSSESIVSGDPHQTAALEEEQEIFDSDGNQLVGLSDEEINAKIAAGEINGEQNIRTKTVWQIIRQNVFTFFNILFVVLAVLLFFFIPQNANGYMQFGFMILVIINTLIGLIQELKAKKTIDKLSLISAPKVTAIRNGKKCEINLADIVRDELVCLNAGCQICADAVLVDGSIEVNESQITGEPDAIQKKVGDQVMSGSYVISGKAVTKVIHIGKENYATKISAGAKYLKKPTSEILRSLNAIIKFMAIVIIPLGFALFFTKYFLNYGTEISQNLKEQINQFGTVAGAIMGYEDVKLSGVVKTVVGSLLGMIPSGLVALSSTVFCISVIRISRHKTLAQDLYCVETLARVDTLCLDKTGTITEGSMQVMRVVLHGGIDEDDFKVILKNVQSSINDENATANAINEFTSDVEATEKAQSVIPFSSARKWSGATFKDASYVMGAAEFVFKNIDKQQKEKLDKYANEGFRVLALAKCESLQGKQIHNPELLGYVLITDKIRPEAPETLKFFKEQGVNIKIISGDNPVTVKAVAKRAGLEDAENYIDLSTLTTDEEVIDAAERYTIFGRVTPDQKLLLVKSLRKKKHTVAMTGDGVNDVLALKEADCSVAMASGSDAAKNVSSLVLLDSNFASMPKVVAEGRRSINNLERSAALYIVKTIYSFLFALIFMLIPRGLPFEPTDMTVIGAVTIGIPSFILALEPNKDIVKGRFISKVLANAIPGALTVVLSVMGVVIASTFIEFEADELKDMYFILTTFASFLFLAKVCFPYTPLRVFLFLAMVGIYLFISFDDFTVFKLSIIFNTPKNVTWDMWRVILVIMAIDIPFFTLLVLAFSRLRNPKIISKISFHIDGQIEDNYEDEIAKADKKLSRIQKINQSILKFFKKFKINKPQKENTQKLEDCDSSVSSDITGGQTAVALDADVEQRQTEEQIAFGAENDKQKPNKFKEFISSLKGKFKKKPSEKSVEDGQSIINGEKAENENTTEDNNKEETDKTVEDNASNEAELNSNRETEADTVLGETTDTQDDIHSPNAENSHSDGEARTEGRQKRATVKRDKSAKNAAAEVLDDGLKSDN